MNGQAWPPGTPGPLPPGHVHVWRVDLDAWPPSARSLSPDECRREGLFRSPLLAARYAAARSALRGLLGGYLGEAPDALGFVTGPHGKPALARPAGLEFNLSHSGPLALVAVARDRRVGIDVERIRAGVEVVAVAARVLGHDVADHLGRLPEPARTAAFFAAWTRHEALAKGIGSGLAYVPRGEAAAWHVADLDAGPGFSAALAVEGAAAQVHGRSWAGRT